MLTNVLQGDAHAVAVEGTENWVKTFFMPVSESEFRDMRRQVYQALEGANESLSSPWNDLLFSDLRFVDHLISFLYAEIIRERCKASGTRIVTSPGALSPFAAHWRDRGDDFSDLSKPTTFRRARQVRRRFLHCSYLPLFRRAVGSLRQSPVWSLGAIHRPKREYLAQYGLLCDFPSLKGMVAAKHTTVPGGERQARSIIHDALANLDRTLGETFGVRIDVPGIVDVWLRRLKALHPAYESMRQNASGCSRLLVAGTGNAVIRATALGAKKADLTVTGFFHAHQAGYTKEREFCYTELGVCDEYVCATEKAAESLTDLARQFPLTRDNNIEFVPQKTMYYRSLWEQHHGRNITTESDTVMVVGFPMNGIRYSYGVGLFDLLRLDFEIRLAKLLKARGIRVLYKPHPETRGIMRGLMGPYVDCVVMEPLEQVYAKGGTLLFTHPFTSTFGFSLCTGANIVILDAIGTIWTPAIRNLLEDRCAFVPMDFDDRGRLRVDDEVLIEAIGKAPGKNDYRYVHEYLIHS